MFPLQSEDEVILFEDPLLEQGFKNLEDLLSDNGAITEGTGVISPEGYSKKRKRDHEVANESKKIMHRDVERQRRQQMAGLYSLLQSLLPPEYIKGNRSISDQIHKAVNYIKYMPKNIKEMQMKRDKLKKLSNSSGKNLNISRSSPCSVTVSPCREEADILISCLNDENFGVSRVLWELLGRGLNTVGYDSARVNGKSLHRIQIEVNDRITLDLSELQDRLTNSFWRKKLQSKRLLMLLWMFFFMASFVYISYVGILFN